MHRLPHAMPEWKSAPVLNADLGPALRHTAHTGADRVPEVLNPSLRQDLLAQLADNSFTALPEAQGRVRQQAEHLTLTGSEIAQFPAVETLRQAVVAAVAAHTDAFAELHRWTPDEVVVQRYFHGSHGISVHRDGKRYRHLVAIFTLDGAAPFRLCTDRAGTTCATWNADTGSLVLLRGPGFGHIPDGRPLHAVGGPRTPVRTSLTLRSRAQEPSC